MLQVKSINKLYENNRGITNISFNAKEGQIVALVGPNGSGKSTSLKIIAGISKADSGECLINGEKTIDVNTKKYIGYLPDEPFIYENMTPIEFLNFVQSMKKNDCCIDIEKRMKDIGLWEFRNNKIKHFSLGMKKKVSLLSALIGNPKLLIMDEPTNGFDTKSIILMKEYIYDLKNKGSIIIISSHILEFISSIADKIVFIKKGSICTIADKNDNLEEIYIKEYLTKN